MSILPVDPLAVTADGPPFANILIILTAISIAAAFISRVLPPRKLPGPDRLPANQSAWPLVGVLFVALGFYMFGASAIMSIWASMAPRYGATTQPMESDAGIALLSVIPPILGLVAILAGDQIVHAGIQHQLGFKTPRVARGLLCGLGAAALILAPLYLTSQLMEFIYRRVHYEHPMEHPLLRALGEGPGPIVKAAIILGACIIAPLGEELVFRAHLQTLLLRTIQWLAGFGNQQAEAPPVLPTVEGLPPIPYQRPLPAIRPWMSWLAILITSALFAIIHPIWSAPIIFLLAIFLGYAYERTGNLWVPITMHAMFNTVSTLLFLAGSG
ncbi:MAG TPA: CPBP family intramembrane glutamic endopeptidase [Tepidisphaeraceae bacterium]|jgi:membrane protease YdiL (CAAX protease family)